MEFNQAANDDQASNVGWFRGQEFALQLATFLCLSAAIIGGFRAYLYIALVFPIFIALILKICLKMAEFIYHDVLEYDGFVVVWFYVLYFIHSFQFMYELMFRWIKNLLLQVI